MFFFLVIICFTVILFRQHHYVSNQLSRTVELLSTIKTYAKFRILSNEYSSVK
jgi:hypothetical protein